MMVVGAIAARLCAAAPSNVFWLAAAAHLALWTLVPALANPNAPLDVIEGFAWGREWLMGTYKHPPMQAWCLEILGLLTNGARWTPYFASALSVVVAFWAVWRTALRLTDERTALLGALLLQGAVYYNFTIPEFNPNVLQLPFWALIAWSFHRGVKENRWFDWALLGLWGACGLYTKYSSALMLGVVAGVGFLHPEARQRFKGAGPYLALGVMLALIAPHAVWLVEGDFLPFTYAGSRAQEAAHVYQRILFPAQFLAAQALSLAGLAVFFFLLIGGRMRRSANFLPHATGFDRFFLDAVALGPLLALLAASMVLGFRPRDMWGACLWNFIGVWLLVRAAPYPDAKGLGRFAKAWLAVFALFLIALPVSNHVYPYVKGKDLRIHFPGKALGESLTKAWERRFGEPLPVVVGDTWVAGNAAYHAGGSFARRPHVFIQGDYRISPWIQPVILHERGAVIVWCSGKCADAEEARRMPPSYKALFPDAEIQQPLTLSRHTQAALPQAVVGWAIVPPAARTRE